MTRARTRRATPDPECFSLDRDPAVVAALDRQIDEGLARLAINLEGRRKQDALARGEVVESADYDPPAMKS